MTLGRIPTIKEMSAPMAGRSERSRAAWSAGRKPRLTFMQRLERAWKASGIPLLARAIASLRHAARKRRPQLTAEPVRIGKDHADLIAEVVASVKRERSLRARLSSLGSRSGTRRKRTPALLTRHQVRNSAPVRLSKRLIRALERTQKEYAAEGRAMITRHAAARKGARALEVWI